MKTTCFAILAFVTLLSGCATPSAQVTQAVPSFDEATCISYIGEGYNTISGQAFATTRGGNVKFAAGKSVYLMPATEYFVGMAGRDFKGLDNRAKKYIQETTADGSGNYSFSRLRDGAYLAVTYLYWSIGNETTGSMLYGMERVSGGGVTRVMVNKTP